MILSFPAKRTVAQPPPALDRASVFVMLIS